MITLHLQTCGRHDQQTTNITQQSVTLQHRVILLVIVLQDTGEGIELCHRISISLHNFLQLVLGTDLTIVPSDNSDLAWRGEDSFELEVIQNSFIEP